MANVNLKSLIDKLNDACKRTLEAAAGLTLSRTHYNVEIEHWLIKLIESEDSDLAILFKHYGIDPARITKDLTHVLDSIKTGNDRPPALSPRIVDLTRQAWLVASLEYNENKVRSAHILYALLTDETLALLVKGASREFDKIHPENLYRELVSLTEGSSESSVVNQSIQEAGGDETPLGKPKGTAALDQYTVDLTDQASQGEIDPVLGREPEIRQIVDILTRRRQNNPILTGEAGVGKTAVVEGLAIRISEGDIPPPLQNVSIRTLDLALLQAGAGVKGEFENRLKSVIDEVKSSPKPIVLFIDEAHTLIGAGGQAGQGDAANLLKPALARGELRTIAATTWAEYKKYFERDAALARRFQVVKVDEPEEKAAIQMMRGLSEMLESHHNVRIFDEAIIESVRLSHRYISGRQLPDKSVSLLDTACARVSIGQNTVPAVIEDHRQRISQDETTIRLLNRESATGADHEERLSDLNAEKNSLEEELEELESRWEQEKDLVDQINAIRIKLEDANLSKETDIGSGKSDMTTISNTDEQLNDWRNELHNLSEELSNIQGEAPLLQSSVDGQAIADVVSTWTGIPVGRMITDEIQAVLQLKKRMEKRIIGQSHVLEAMAQTIRTARANLTDPRKPLAVFLFVGPSGVGKTETAITLADLLYGGDQNMTVINMSEFKEEHKVSLLMGSPPGYVGYGEGGVLTEAVRRKPYSIVLLDEMEKAHPGVQDIFYQVFDKGTLRDGEGRDIDFKNTIIIMTSNAASDDIIKFCSDPDTMPDSTALAKSLRPELLKTFKPAFLGRVNVVPYYPLEDNALKSIVELQLNRIKQRIKENYRATFNFSPELSAGIASRCHEVETGARNIDHILTKTLLPELSAEFLSRMAEGENISAASVSLDKKGNFQYKIS